jgi:hypothetical protein
MGEKDMSGIKRKWKWKWKWKGSGGEGFEKEHMRTRREGALPFRRSENALKNVFARRTI